MDLDLGRRSIVEWAETAPEEEAGAVFTPAEEKFVVETVIGQGGMGEVLLVTDQDLKRQIAMKVLRRDVAQGREQRLHFIAEAQATSQLEHPGIPPVHDIGLTKDGRLYFTMKLIQGRTLRDVLHDLTLKRKEVAREYNLHKLTTVLERMCEALHFSHERGVIHRDIKPENIMLGDYGEVHLMDWGLARVESGSDIYADFETVQTARTDAGMETQGGAIKGTLPYMSPEQMRGETLDRRSDLYAVGCMLYELLCLHTAFDPRDPEMMSRKQTGKVADVRTRNPRRRVPEALALVCEKAMASDPAGRYATAEELADALRRWLDGRSERERRHKEAEELAAKGHEAAERYLALRAEIATAGAQADDEAKRYKSFQPVSEKRSAIEARRRVEDLRVELALSFAECEKLLGAALLREEDNPSAKAELVRIWGDRLAVAERRRESADIAYARVMVERYSGEPLKSVGTLSLRSDPPGAEVLLFRYEARDGVLTPVDERPLGQTPVAAAPYPEGSYLCILKKHGFRDTRYPVQIRRGRRWDGEVRLRTDEEIGEDFVYVPAGPFVYGEGKEATTRELPDFAVARYPVTFNEYAEYLGTLDAEEVAQRMPRTDGDDPYMAKGDDGRYRPLPILVQGEAHERCVERFGADYAGRIPIMGIDWNDAAAYCAWKTETTGREWRLPTEEEWEKAARGVDGRRFAWGGLEDASLGKCRESREEEAQPEPVGAFPTSESVYGMGDAPGLMRVAVRPA